MTLKEAIKQIPAEEDLYTAPTDLYIIRTKELCSNRRDGLFMVLYKTEGNEWRSGVVWFGIHTDREEVIDFLERFAGGSYSWMMETIDDYHGYYWDDWQVVTLDGFVQYVREKVLSACS